MKETNFLKIAHEIALKYGLADEQKNNKENEDGKEN